MSDQDCSRITAEVSADDMDTLQKASQLAGVTIAQFIVQSGLAIARLQSTDRDHFRPLHEEDVELLGDLLENPPVPNEALRRA
ncbi:MAG TPA: DUF1778 domain-containing protein, partial [Telluria sp.]